MLRRKLLFNLAPLIALLLTTAVAAIVLLQRVLGHLGGATSHARASVGDVSALTEPLAAIASDLVWLRWIVLGLAVVFLLIINISIVVLLRTGAMILHPMDKLIEATRQLARERFDYRVDLEQHDEFGELARAYNRLAEQLQANERKRFETLGQVSLALNHELNNAMAIIDLQLRVLSRPSPNGGASHDKCLRQIHESLDRMAKTVQSLKNVRRIVLTDYVSGMKMLDLRRSLEEDEPGPAPGACPAVQVTVNPGAVAAATAAKSPAHSL